MTGEENYRALRDIFREELPDWKRIGIKNMTLGEEERMLWSRMLLSCLVDADYTASAEEDGEIIPEPPKCDAENWLERLNAHRAELARNSTADKNSMHCGMSCLKRAAGRGIMRRGFTP